MNRILLATLLSALLGMGALGAGVAQAHSVSRSIHVENVRALPTGYQRIDHRGIRYAYRDGRFLEHRHGHWVVVRPPHGILVPTLPRQVSVVVRGPHRHYLHHDVSYRRVRGGYVVDYRW